MWQNYFSEEIIFLRGHNQCRCLSVMFSGPDEHCWGLSKVVFLWSTLLQSSTVVVISADASSARCWLKPVQFVWVILLAISFSIFLNLKYLVTNGCDANLFYSPFSMSLTVRDRSGPIALVRGMRCSLKYWQPDPVCWAKPEIAPHFWCLGCACYPVQVLTEASVSGEYLCNAVCRTTRPGVVE